MTRERPGSGRAAEQQHSSRTGKLAVAAHRGQGRLATGAQAPGFIALVRDAFTQQLFSLFFHPEDLQRPDDTQRPATGESDRAGVGRRGPTDPH